MESLMSHLLMSAAYRMQLPPSQAPLDLTSPPKFLTHVCDRLINPEDLRNETLDLASATHENVRYLSGSASDSGTDVSVTDSTAESSGISDDSIHIKREVETPPPVHAVTQPHPFSIASILGDSVSSPGGPPTPAVVTSPTFPSAPHIAFRDRYTASSRDVSFWCHVCNALCTNANDARTHQYVHSHGNAACSLRKSMFSAHGYVTRHTRVDEERIQCGLCGKVVALCFFPKHQRLHDRHFCHVCKKEFATNSRLTDHMNVHSGSTPFSCTICERKFSKRSSLTQHYRYHRDHRSFQCSFCSKYFNSKYACAVHERLHTGENPFRCTYPGCDKAYPQKIQLKLHLCSHRDL